MSLDLILASSSSSRNRLLVNAGVRFRAVSPGIDEDVIKREGQLNQQRPNEVAEMLAKAKAFNVGKKYKQATVIGSDQILFCNGDWFDKPANLDIAQKQLERLSGQVHQLVNATVIIQNNMVVWTHQNIISVEMCNLSPNLIDKYLAKEGKGARESVGAYKLEGRGVQLLKEVDGDFFSILGLPMLPLLSFLREQGLLS